jgi:riboflavin biosynthesis pyrimidine reductase
MPEVARSNAITPTRGADRFVMGLLRVAAFLVVATGTIRTAPHGTWRADRVFPACADAFAELRRRLGKREHPAVAVVTAGGSFDPTHPVLESGAIVLTTERAAPEIRASVPAATDVVAVNHGEWVDPAAAIDVLRAHGGDVVLSEGGPTLFTSFIEAGVVDELFLTVAPLLAGRSGSPRLSLADGAEFLPRLRVAGELRSLRRHESHLFLRYALGVTSRRA